MLRFRYKPEELKDNPYVYKVDRLNLKLETGFRIKLFRLWKAGDMERIARELESKGLGPDKTGENYIEELAASFKNSGYPVGHHGAVTSAPEENPLIRSGKFFLLDNGRGLRISPAFENELFSVYPEIPVEEAIARSGLDPVDVGYQRIQRLKTGFDKKTKGRLAQLQWSIPEEVHCFEERKQSGEGSGCDAQKHPYVQGFRNGSVVMREAFYNEACFLSGIGLDGILEMYEMDPDWFGEREKVILMSKISRWSQTEENISGCDDIFVRISRARAQAMERLVEEGFGELREKYGEMDITARRRLAGWIAELPRDPWHYYTTSRILGKVGIAKSTYYELLGNEDYGMSACRRLARDDEDIMLVRRVADYKGFAKGYRQISMMMETVTGQTMSEHRVLYLMRKYGMRTNIRRPSKNRKAMKELMKRNGKENLLMRRFKQHRPNEVRLTDVTYLDYGDGMRAYGSASIDPVTNRLICFVISENNDLQLALDTLEAMDAYPAVNGGIIHSDQGILYFTDDFQAAVADRNLIQSMSRRGNCWDNAPQESFFGHFKDESGYRKCKTLDELRRKVQDYSVYYNEERRIHNRGKMTPAEYEAYLCALDEDAFAAYMAAEEGKYLEKKEKAAAKAADRARARQEAIEARLEEINDETGRQES